MKPQASAHHPKRAEEANRTIEANGAVGATQTDGTGQSGPDGAPQRPLGTEGPKEGRFKRRDLARLGGGVLGTLLFTLSLNLFIVPMNFYNGGVVGIAQILRTVLVRYLNLSPHFDLSGILVYAINLPLFFLAYRELGKGLFVRTLVCVTLQALFLSVLPIPKQPIVDDPLTAALIGGFCSGFGIGLVLRSGCSSGGLDIVGLYCATKRQNFSVGRLSLLVNVGVYGVCLLLFDAQVVVYSLIFTCVQTFSMDRLHAQNINVEALIFTKREDDTLQQTLMRELQRGVTYWEGYGAYTGDRSRILYTVVSKYEVPRLKRLVRAVDAHAFISVKEGLDVSDNFIKRLL